MVVSPQVTLTRRETEEPKQYGLVFTMPEDLQAIYTKFGIDLPAGNGDGTWRLPVPARFVIDRDGIIRAADADPDYTRRPEPAQTVEVLLRLAGR